MMNKPDTPVLVVLVHGTFGRGAPWTQPTVSPLCARLRRVLGPTVRFEPFEWSGDNRHADRVDAGRALAGRLEDLAAQQPRPRLFVIGHSHGGTVITHALRGRPQLARALDGIVFLSTPFIQVRRRPHAVALTWLVGLVLGAAALWLVGQAVFYMRMFGWPGWLSEALTFLALAAMMFGLIFAINESRPDAIGSRKRRHFAALDRAIERLRDEFSVRNLNRRRTLFLRANADEASAGLAWVQAISRLLGEFFDRSLRWLQLLMPWKAVDVVESGRGHVGWLAKAVIVTGLLVASIAALELVVIVLVWVADMIVRFVALFGLDLAAWISNRVPAASKIADTYWTVRGVTDGLMIWVLRMLMLAAAVVLAFAAAVLAIFNRAFGRWFLSTALFVEVSVEPAPPGRWTLCQLEPPDQTKDWSVVKGASLTHSLSYEDPRAQRIIASWILHRIAKPATQ
jgi:pimeloyl-ACP methyl ester carboxylesterase